MKRLASGLLAALLLACDRDVPRPAPGVADSAAAGDTGEAGVSTREPAPRAELLLEAGDSTFWMRSGPEGIRLRGSPVLLARVDGRFQELYVADDDHSYYDAVFVGQELWRRDLVTGDSTRLLADTVVAAAARRWARRNPGARPLAPDEDESADPSTIATGEIEVLDVVGAWVSVELHVDVDVAGEPHRHALRRQVLDVRDGRAVPLGELVGPDAARAAVAEARRRYEAALDSVRQARDERGRRAARALAGFPFDSTSFGLTARDGAPAIAFLVPGRGEDAGGRGLELAPVVVPPPAWWRDVGVVLPRTVADSVDRWQVGALTLDAVWQGPDAPLRLELRDGTGRSWPAGRVPPPPRWLLPLDAPAIDSTARRALARAFDESALYSDEARTVAHQRRPAAARAAARPHSRT